MQKYFPAGLHRTWVQNAARFSQLEQALNSPFSSSLQFSRELDGYLQHVEEEFTQARLIGQADLDQNAITLVQVFVPLRAYIAESQVEKNLLVDSSVNPDSKLEKGEGKKKVVQLFAELEGWIANVPNHDVVRVVSGGPGIGKSSSIRAFAAKVAKQGHVYPVVVPLQRLEKADQPLADRITHYFSSTKYFRSGRSPLDPENPTRAVLLIFDGLDELVRPGKDADEIAREFMIDLRRLLESENGRASRASTRVLAVVTGRIASAASAARALKLAPSQVLHLLRFAERSTKEFVDPDGLLDEDQRETWWKKWQSAAPNVPERLPAVLRSDSLFDVTVEPLLLYFTAVVSTELSGDAASQFNRNRLYDLLLNNFYDRECSKGALNFATEFDSFEDYEVVLQAMAFAAWYDGSTRTGTIDVVIRLLTDWTEGVAESFLRVIGADRPAISAALAFYLKPGERPNSFEFLHKTFAEYLVSRRLIEAVSAMASARRISLDHVPSKRKRAFSIVPFLEDWLRLVGPRPIDMDLVQFLRDEMMQHYAKNAGTLKEWRGSLADALRLVIRDGFPAHNLSAYADSQLVRRPQTFRDAEEQARNAEIALLAILNASILPEIDDPEFSCIDVRSVESSALPAFLDSLRSSQHLHVTNFLSGLDFREQNLSFQNFVGIRAVKADFSGANLLMSIFVLGNLEGAKFRLSELKLANFEAANLKNADFELAKAKGAVFAGTDLAGANFRGADVTEANFDQSTLKETNFEKAIFDRTSFIEPKEGQIPFERPKSKGVITKGRRRVGRLFRGEIDLYAGR